MKRKIGYRYLSTHFSYNDDGNNGARYDGCLTIKFRYGGYDTKGRNPLMHKQIKQIITDIRPFLQANDLPCFVVNCEWGEMTEITFQYVKEINSKFIFDEVIKLTKKYLDK